MNANTLFITGFATAIGLAAALIGWMLSRAVADVPAEDREYKDPPPTGFRVLWWPIQWVSFYLDRLMSEKGRQRIQARLRRAQLDYCLSPAQFVASRLIAAGAFAGLFHWILASIDQARAVSSSEAVYAQVLLVGALLGWVYPAIWLRDRIAATRRELMKALPFFLDLITLCVEAGLNLQGAMNQAVSKGPKGGLRDEFQRVLRDIRAGNPRADSLRKMADRIGESGVTSFVAAVIQAESLGMSLGPVLRAQADQRRTERFLRAEKLAMEAPVKMLFPLIAFIFPCTFIVLFFPIVMKLMASGL